MVILTPEHRYLTTDGSTEYMAVTDAFADLGIIDRRFYTEQATSRGTRVHRAISAFITEQEFELQDEDAPYFDAFLEFRRDTFPPDFRCEVEKIVYDDVYGLAGSIDMLAWDGERCALIDWKTGGEAVWHPWQLQMYALLLRETPTLLNVYLKDAPGKDGKRYKMVPQADYSLAFVQAVALVINMKRKHGLIPR